MVLEVLSKTIFMEHARLVFNNPDDHELDELLICDDVICVTYF